MSIRPEEIIERLTEQWEKANDSPTDFIGYGSFNGEEDHIIVGLNREPTRQEAAQAQTEIDGERVEYRIFSKGNAPVVWTPPKAAP